GAAMSLRRGPRCRSATRKGPRKAAVAKRDWDSTIQDLTVHQATPEDILLRHEIHKSKNTALARLELQEKALRRKWRKPKQVAFESLEQRKLAVMREILSHQYHQDLAAPEQLVAVAKDSAGDAPRTRAGFPNVTMAPNCDLEPSQGPIAPKYHLSILSESDTHSQALKEGEELSMCQAEDGHHGSLNFQSSPYPDRLLQLREENSLENSPLWPEKDMRKAPLSQELLTPTAASPSLDQSGLNATNVIKRIQSRLQQEAEEETADRVRQVLNPKLKPKQTAAKMKRKTPQTSPGERSEDSPPHPIPLDFQRDNRYNLDLLNQLIHEVEQDLEEYEQCTGREVQRPERRGGGGVTGFTWALLRALCRMLRYTRESELQLREQKVLRQQQEEMLKEHRELIDALTAEILLVREENITLQEKLQHYMLVTDEQLSSLTQALQGLPLAEATREPRPKHAGLANKDPESGQGKPDWSSLEPRAAASKKESLLELPQDALPLQVLQRPADAGAGRSLAAALFQPAVLLSPPRQQSRQQLSPLQNATSLPAENSQRQACKERSSPPSLRAQSPAEESSLMSEMQPTPPAETELETCHHKITLSCPSAAGKISPAEEFLPNSDLQAKIAELTWQNSLIKAQLSKLGSFAEDNSECLHQPEAIHSSHPAPDSSQGQLLEARLAQLHRQSTEVQEKLLQLMEQQSLAAEGLLPPSPNHPDNARTTAVAVAVAPDSSREENLSPASVTSVRRSVGDSSKPSSPSSATPESVKLAPCSQRPKVEKQKEEGWFALSMHLM
ncbi:SPICE protein, partial [Bucco capensis]|nr:SPICE protein [Bucco capensis]